MGHASAAKPLWLVWSVTQPAKNTSPLTTTFNIVALIASERSWLKGLSQAVTHFRDKDGMEVDIVLEKAGTVAGVKIKSAATVMEKDFRGLKKLRETTGERFAAGVVMYDGEHVAGFGENLYAIPIRALWETM
jgi:predicted AAA+ superfamily ATPase